MRLFALLFALYLACLACLPCADEVQADVEQVQTSVSIGSPAEGGSARRDWCSPLCQCQCCAGVVLPGLAAGLAAAPGPRQWVVGVRHARLVVPAPTQVVAAVWQPPRA